MGKIYYLSTPHLARSFISAFVRARLCVCLYEVEYMRVSV